MIIESFSVKLDVQPNQTQEVKKLGAKPYFDDGKFICWYVPKGNDLEPFKNFWGGKYRYRFSQSNNENLTLTDYLLYVKAIISENISQGDWIVANVNDVTGKYHTYLDLSDYDENGNETSKAKAAIFGSKKSLLDKFYKETGFRLGANQKVMIKVTTSFNEKYGMTLVVEDINPLFTVGDMEAKLQKIRMKLREDGLYESNKRLNCPNNFFNVAVIAPDNAAGLGDFKTMADKLSSLKICNFDYFSAVFQGDTLVKTFKSAAELVINNHKITPYDALVVIRGGGDKAGLYHLNNYEVAKAILELRIPIICGIGHDKDHTIIDEISNIRMATPSMAVNFIKDMIIKANDDYKNTISRIRQGIENIMIKSERSREIMISNIKSQTEMRMQDAVSVRTQALEQIKSGALRAVGESSKNRESLILNICSSSRLQISSTEDKRKMIFKSIMTNNPISMLGKGYSIISQKGLVGEISDGSANIYSNENKYEVEIKIHSRSKISKKMPEAI